MTSDGKQLCMFIVQEASVFPTLEVPKRTDHETAWLEAVAEGVRTKSDRCQVNNSLLKLSLLLMYQAALAV